VDIFTGMFWKELARIITIIKRNNTFHISYSINKLITPILKYFNKKFSINVVLILYCIKIFQNAYNERVSQQKKDLTKDVQLFLRG